MLITRSLGAALLAALLTACLAGGDVRAAPTVPAVNAVDRTAPMQIDWQRLLPANERANPQPAAPPPLHDYLSEGDLVALQTGSYEVNQELDNRRVRVPGFVVPLEQAADGRLSEFLLVPYFGACIHFPPPPPNQVIYVRMRPGTGPKSADDALWVTGLLHLSVQKSEMGSTAYLLDADGFEIYPVTP